VTGFSVTHHIQEQLMREARRLLSQPGTSVSETAGALGFESEKYVNRIFRKSYRHLTGLVEKKPRATVRSLLEMFTAGR